MNAELHVHLVRFAMSYYTILLLALLAVPAHAYESTGRSTVPIIAVVIVAFAVFVLLYARENGMLCFKTKEDDWRPQDYKREDDGAFKRDDGPNEDETRVAVVAPVDSVDEEEEEEDDVPANVPAL